MGVFYFERPATLRGTWYWKRHNYRVVYIIICWNMQGTALDLTRLQSNAGEDPMTSPTNSAFEDASQPINCYTKAD
jgi:hypothetical protein